MEFFDLVDISEKYMEIINPSSPEKILKIGKFLRLEPGKKVIDFGCGFAEPLVLWAEAYGIDGVGIDIRPNACIRATAKIKEKKLETRIEIVCMSGADYQFIPASFDAAVCIGASFIFGGFRQTIQAMRKAIRPEGRLAIGEPYWLKSTIPPEYVRLIGDFHTEHELVQIARQEGFDFEYLVRSSQDDWDRYEADNWHGLVRWLEENTDHPERDQVAAHLRKSQDEYFQYGREYLGWEMIVLAPQT